jgi:hypothetical protein
LINLIFAAHSTGWNSDIWKELQVNIYRVYIASTETNDTSEKKLYYTKKNVT